MDRSGAVAKQEIVEVENSSAGILNYRIVVTRDMVRRKCFRW